MLKLALVGYGRWGQKIVDTLATIPEVSLRVICTPQSVDVKDIPNQCTVVSDSKEVLHHSLDAVIVATPGSTHAEVALPFIEKGWPVFIEKPLTTNVADALRVKKSAEKSGALVCVGHIHVYNPAYLKAKELAKLSGKVRSLLFEGGNNGPYRDDMSALWDWAPHDVALALDLLEQLPTQVQAWGVSSLRPTTQLYDTIMMKLTFPDTTALFHESWLSPEKKKQMTIMGTQHTIIFNDVAAKKVVFYQEFGPHVTDGQVIPHAPTISYPDYDHTPPLRAELEAFITAIKTKQPSRTSLQQGVDVVSIIAAAEQSIALDGKKVKC